MLQLPQPAAHLEDLDSWKSAASRKSGCRLRGHDIATRLCWIFIQGLAVRVRGLGFRRSHSDNPAEACVLRSAG